MMARVIKQDIDILASTINVNFAVTKGGWRWILNPREQALAQSGTRGIGLYSNGRDKKIEKRNNIVSNNFMCVCCCRVSGNLQWSH